MRHLDVAGYFDRADFKVHEVRWTLALQFVEAYGGGVGYQFTADFVAEPPERTVKNVTVRVPRSDIFPRDRVLEVVRDRLATGSLHHDETVTCEAAEGGES